MIWVCKLMFHSSDGRRRRESDAGERKRDVAVLGGPWRKKGDG